MPRQRGANKNAGHYEVRRSSRLAQITAWMGGREGDGDCMIILDECHRAKSLLATKGTAASSCMTLNPNTMHDPDKRLR